MVMYKVLNISEEGRGGGALGRIRIISNELKGKIDTVIIVPKNSRKYIESLRDLKLEYRELRMHPMTKNFAGAIMYFIFFIPEIVGLIRLIIDEKPDLIHCNGSWQIKGVIASWLTGVRSVWHMNDTYQPVFVERLFRMTSWLPTGYIYASERTKKYYQRLNTRIANKTYSSILVAPVDRQQIQPINRRREKPIRMLIIGYINIHKGIELLIKAASLLVEENIEIDIVGPVLESQKAYMEGLEGVIRELQVENISFLGYQKVHNELLERYHYYVCSSIREASPMAVWESLSAGLPVVSTDVGDVKEIIEKNQCGVIAKEMNGASLAVAIRALINQSDKEYEQMSKNAIRASALFDKKEVAKHYLNFYNQVIGEQHS